MRATLVLAGGAATRFSRLWAPIASSSDTRRTAVKIPYLPVRWSPANGRFPLSLREGGRPTGAMMMLINGCSSQGQSCQQQHWLMLLGGGDGSRLLPSRVQCIPRERDGSCTGGPLGAWALRGLPIFFLCRCELSLAINRPAGCSAAAQQCPRREVGPAQKLWWRQAPWLAAVRARVTAMVFGNFFCPFFNSPLYYQDERNAWFRWFEPKVGLESFLSVPKSCGCGENWPREVEKRWGFDVWVKNP